MIPEAVTREELVRRYCARQESTPGLVEDRMRQCEKDRDVEGWMLLECAVMDSSRLGEYTLVAFGPGCTNKQPPTHPVSPRGLASDMSVVVATAPR